MDLPYKALLFNAVIAACSLIGNAVAEQSSAIMCRSGTVTTLSKTEDTYIYTVSHRGIILSQDAARLFDNFTHECVGSVAVVRGKYSGGGFCRYVDPATGDLLFGAWTAGDKPGTGTYTYIGGTGKWKGISGSGDYQVVAPTRALAEGTYQNCVRTKDTFTLP